jgi:hypothetical protein
MAKSATVLFNQGMLEFSGHCNNFSFFIPAANRGHGDAMWILQVVEGVKVEALKEAFLKTESPLGWYFAGALSREEHVQKELWRTSAEKGCPWGQVAYGREDYEDNFAFGEDEEEEREKLYLTWLKKAGNNAFALCRLGVWHFDGRDRDLGAQYLRAASDLGWRTANLFLAKIAMDKNDVFELLRNLALGRSGTIFSRLKEVSESEGLYLQHDLNRVCYTLGWGFFWHLYETAVWERAEEEEQIFANRCLDYYCSCVEIQRDSIFTFLLCWNQMTGGVKGPGQMIGKRVLEEREANLVKSF